MNVVIAALLAKPRLKRHEINYFIGFHHLVQSLRRHHQQIPPIVVLSPDLNKPPAGADELVRIDTRPYRAITNVQKAFGKSVYFKLDIFRLPYDRVVYLDTDVLPLQPIDPLWSVERFNEKEIYGVRECPELGLTNPDWKGRLNAGVMVINKPMLNESTFAGLLDIACNSDSYDLGDQGVLNAYLCKGNRSESVGVLPTRYNIPSCVRTDGDWERFSQDIAMMHYLGPRKPWMNAPEHHWYHADTQALWDREVANHASLPRGGPSLRSSLHTRLVRAVQWYEEWRGWKE